MTDVEYVVMVLNGRLTPVTGRPSLWVVRTALTDDEHIVLLYDGAAQTTIGLPSAIKLFAIDLPNENKHTLPAEYCLLCKKQNEGG